VVVDVKVITIARGVLQDKQNNTRPTG
jgi:hypothetical protein